MTPERLKQEIRLAVVSCFPAFHPDSRVFDIVADRVAEIPAIKAAPDTLESLRMLLKTALACDDHAWAFAIAMTRTDRPCDRASAAIAQAEGAEG